MNIDIKYDHLHKYTLSISTFFLIISVIPLIYAKDTINFKLISFIILYSIIGIICSVFAWSRIESKINETKDIRANGLYHPAFDDSKIQEKLSESQRINNYLCAVLLIIFLLMVLIWVLPT